MADLCSKKKMLIAICAIFVVSLIVLVIQGIWSNSQPGKHIRATSSILKKKGKVNLTCPSGEEEYAVPCQKCSKYELRMEIHACQEYGFKETIVCDDGQKITRPCDLSPAVHRMTFWTFELITLVIFLVSYTLVKNRQQRLDHNLMEKINKQIAA